MIIRMSAHSSTLVPLESWCYNSPEIRRSGSQIDIGLLAEALIYYEGILLEPGNEPQFAELLRWFECQGRLDDFRTLLADKTIRIYHYAFISSAVCYESRDTWDVLNIQDPEQSSNPQSFIAKYFRNRDVCEVLPHARQRERFIKAIQDGLVEVKAGDFGAAIKNALSDFLEPERSAFLLQSLLNEVHPLLGFQRPQQIKARIEKGKTTHQIIFNVDFDHIGRMLGRELNFHKGTPLTGAVHRNRLLWSAAVNGCDVYLGSPMSALVEQKLNEAGASEQYIRSILGELIGEVEFPDVRTMINRGEIGIDEVLHLRERAKRFRLWLQEEAERDRNALFAYHNEVARESGWIKTGRRSLRLFGAICGSATPAIVGAVVAGVGGAVIGGLAGKAAEYISDLVAKIGEGWRPIVFGRWASEYLQNRRKAHHV